MKLVKSLPSLGILVGWACVCTVDGKEFVDSQGDHISDDVATEAFAKFAAGDRQLKLEHRGASIGTVLWILPITAEIAAALGIATRKTGVVIGVKPNDPDMIARFERGEITGLSIGGRGSIED